MGIVVILVVLLVASVGLGHAWGGGRGFGGPHGFRGRHGFRGHHGGFGGPSVFLGVGPYWGPYWAPYIYPPMVFAPPDTVYVEPTTPDAVLPPALYWYYCDDPQGYYPYVTECPGGWRPVVPTPQ